MSPIHSFPPVENPNATVLILGSMPGDASLHAGEYYAYPRNHFWRIMAALIALDPDSSYEQRIKALQSSRIALWDVLHSCSRVGSLDSNIEKATQVVNDFESFFVRHKKITHVFFNGSAAEQIYRSKVLTVLKLHHLVYKRLPSTSPACASFSFERKLEAWKAILLGDPTQVRGARGGNN